jgi:hypothetical protein
MKISWYIKNFVTSSEAWSSALPKHMRCLFNSVFKKGSSMWSFISLFLCSWHSLHFYMRFSFTVCSPCVAFFYPYDTCERYLRCKSCYVIFQASRRRIKSFTSDRVYAAVPPATAPASPASGPFFVHQESSTASHEHNQLPKLPCTSYFSLLSCTSRPAPIDINTSSFDHHSQLPFFLMFLHISLNKND